MEYKVNNKKRGFTIIELILTIVILSFGIIGVYNVFSPFISLNSNLYSRFTAAYLAQEGVEIVKNLRDHNFVNSTSWSNGLLICNLGCQADYKAGTLVAGVNNQLQSYDPNKFLKLDSEGFYSYDGSTDTIFKRKITITEDPPPDVLKVDVSVTWDFNGQFFNFDTVEYIYNWHLVQ